MATLLSRPINLIVYANITAAPAWGSGSAVGSLQADVWTPGRDGADAVNLASWNTVPLNRWVQVGGTRLDALDAAVKAAVPGWRDYGVEGWSGVTDDWSGFAIDSAGSRMWLMGGGHVGSSNNGLYRFDALKMAWAIENPPSDPSPWSTAYKTATSGGFGACLESRAAGQAKFSAGTLSPVNDWYGDELYWDRKPCARHVYSSMVYVPETNELVMAHYRLWRFSLSSQQWTYKRLIRDSFPVWMDAENGVAIYDEATREVLVSSAGSTGIYRATGYSLPNNQWTNWTSPWNLYSGIADVRVGRRVVVVLPAAAAAGTNAAQPGRYWDYNLDTRTGTTSTLQFADGLAIEQFAPINWYYDSASLAYIPSKNRYWFFTLMANNKMELIEIDPTTTPWTARRATGMTGNVPNPGKNLERKMIYLPALNAVVLCDSAKKDLSLYRF